ncbi:MAG: SMP-30/gluconolactonase/LRE family protein [Verrucomicrobiales bacterium]
MLRPLLPVILAGACSAAAQDTTNFPVLGKILRLDPRLDALLGSDASIEVIGSGFEWCEGPVWIPDTGHKAGGYLLFSEIPSNTVRRWDEGKGLSVFLKCSGYTGPGQYSAEPGSNGLTLDSQGRLLSCEHGDRRVSVLTTGGGKQTLTDNFEGRRFNSPNDLCVKSNGDIYFTDPIYGLPERENDKLRELDICGVYKFDTRTRKTALLTDVLARPNGIAFSPDEKILYVAQSDPGNAIWMAFPVKDDGTLGDGKIFKDVTAMVRDKKVKGLPDGLKVDKNGNLWATGPGGVHVMAPDGTLLGRLDTGEATSNCAFGGPDGTTLYLTADMYLCRVKTKVTGAASSRAK